MDTKSPRKPYRILPPETWEQIRRDYESGTSADLLCRQYGVSQSTLFSRRQRDDWVRTDPVCIGLGPLNVEEVVVGQESSHDRINEAMLSRMQDSGMMSSTTEEHALAAGAAPSPPCSEIAPVGDPVAVNRSHVSLASALRHRIGQLAGDDRLGAGPQGRMSRSAVDLATAIEKLQKVERKALEMDNGQPVNNVQMVILAPAKMDPEEWASHVLEGRGTQVG